MSAIQYMRRECGDPSAERWIAAVVRDVGPITALAPSGGLTPVHELNPDPQTAPKQDSPFGNPPSSKKDC